jgi:C4-dicarboxylate transporter DctQ subunit
MQRLGRWLVRVEDGAMVAGMVVATVLIGTQVVLRYVFDTSITWAEELTRYAIVWMSFVGAGMGVRASAHITVDLIPAALPEQGRALLRRAMAVAGTGFGLVLAWLGTVLVLRAFEGGQVSPALEAPMYLVYLVIPLGGGLLAFRFLEVLREAPGAERIPAGDAVEVEGRKGGM